MNNKRTDRPETAPAKRDKRPYNKPVLVEHGDVATLTQSGAGTTSEGGGGMAGGMG